MDQALRDLVYNRARNRCEYCKIPQEHFRITFHVEHITAKQHGGTDEASNLALPVTAVIGIRDQILAASIPIRVK